MVEAESGGRLARWSEARRRRLTTAAAERHRPGGSACVVVAEAEVQQVMVTQQWRPRKHAMAV